MTTYRQHISLSLRKFGGSEFLVEVYQQSLRQSVLVTFDTAFINLDLVRVKFVQRKCVPSARFFHFDIQLLYVVLDVVQDGFLQVFFPVFV